MSIEQKFIDLIKEGKVSDAMQSIKEALTNMSGDAIVDQKYAIAEKYGMKKKEDLSEEDDDDKNDDDKKKEDDDKDDEEDKEKDE